MKAISPASAPPRRDVGLFLLFFAVTLFLQYLSGTYRSEFAAYPDESAHYVTGLMFRDYIAGFHYLEPVKFAKDYYTYYPKVAIGHWPPLLYIVEGFWMLVFSPARASILIELALLTALLASLTYAVAKPLFGWLNAALAATLLITLPIVQVYADEVMAESLLTLLSLAAAIHFARYLESNHWRHSALFGLFASLAILTKGNGWDLALIPPVVLILTRNFRVIRTWVFWLPALIVVALCIPWQLQTWSLAQRGWQGGDKPNIAYTTRALGELLLTLFHLVGWGLALFILIGIASKVVIPLFQKRIQPLWATLFALIVAAVLFHAIVPAGVEPRKLIIAVPALVLFLFAGIDWVGKVTRFHSALVIAAALTVFAFEKFSIPVEIHYGYDEAARFIHNLPDPQDSAILISSERDGEGMLVSELAMIEKRPSHHILRATKILSSTDWNGKILERYVTNPDALVAYLHRAGIRLVVTDTLPPVISFDHQRLLNQAIVKYPDQLKLLATFHGEVKGDINVYRVN